MQFALDQRIGHGLINLGNSCFLAATVQCLTHLAPFANLSLSHKHQTACKTLRNEGEFCAACVLHSRIEKGLRQTSLHRPTLMHRHLKKFADHFSQGQQASAFPLLHLACCIARKHNTWRAMQ